MLVDLCKAAELSVYVTAGAIAWLQPGGAGAVGSGGSGRIGNLPAGTDSQPQAALEQHFSAISGGSQQWQHSRQRRGSGGSRHSAIGGVSGRLGMCTGTSSGQAEPNGFTSPAAAPGAAGAIGALLPGAGDLCAAHSRGVAAQQCRGSRPAEAARGQGACCCSLATAGNCRRRPGGAAHCFSINYSCGRKAGFPHSQCGRQ